ncbi:MAG: winged helix-turn-helix domain-containing protein [Candidatus Bathyarchaeia archaeon]
MKNLGKRDRHDIVVEILEKAKSGKKKTELMRSVGLSHSRSKQYLTILLKKGLLEINENNLFTTSKKGLEFLEKCGECLLFDWTAKRKP